MKHVRVTSKFGKMVAFDNDLITNQIIKFGNHTRPEFAFGTCVLREGQKVFDIGGHIGTFALEALHKVGPDGLLAAFEANPETFPLLKNNLKTLSPFNSVAVRTIVSGTDDVGYGIDGVEANSGAANVIKKENGTKGMPLDNLITKYFEPDFIKLDIEGMEYDVLSNSEYVVGKRPILYLEVAREPLKRAGASIGQLARFLTDFGYCVFANVGPRNGPFDCFKVQSVPDITQHHRFFDALCVQTGSPEHQALQACC